MQYTSKQQQEQVIDYLECMIDRIRNGEVAMSDYRIISSHMQYGIERTCIELEVYEELKGE